MKVDTHKVIDKVGLIIRRILNHEFVKLKYYKTKGFNFETNEIITFK